MDIVGKYLSLCLVVILAVSSLFIIKPVIAQSPSATPYPTLIPPEFTVDITDTTYYVPITNSYDPTTGQMIANTSYYNGYVDSLNVTISIKNQPIIQTTYSDYRYGFKYIVELNGISLAGGLNGFGQVVSGGFVPSNGSLTTLTLQFSNPYFPIGARTNYPFNSSGLTYATNPIYPIITIGKNALFTVQVQIFDGEVHTGSMGNRFLEGNFSDWNHVTLPMTSGQTVSISNQPATTPIITPTSQSTTTPTITPTSSPSVPEFSIATLLLVVLSAVSLLLVVGKRKLIEHTH
jgi:hypothetical protein